MSSGAILVVDDDSTYQFIVRKAFSKEELSDLAVFAETGVECRAAFERAQPRLVLLDVNLPDTTGFELLEWIRVRSRVPVLMHSWSATRENIDRAHQGGANGYVEKQASLEKLRAFIRTLYEYWILQNRF